MKKLMIMAVAVVAGVAAQAAAITWSASQISKGDGITWTGGQTATYGAGYAAYLFLSESTLAADKDYLVKASDIEAALAKGDTSVLSKAVKTATTGANGNVVGTTVGTYGVGQPDTVKGFMVVINDDVPADATQFAISTEKTATFASGQSGNTPMGFSTYTANYAWQSIPEPTSGLLLLIGVAGLALRRRRA